MKSAKNGLILEVTHEYGEKEIYTYQGSNDESDEIRRFSDFLYEISANYGPTTSRYSKERIHIEIKPGDKYEDENVPNDTF